MVLRIWCLRCLLLVMCTYSIAKEALMLHLARGEGREHYFGCNLLQRKVLASSHQHLMAEAPINKDVGVHTKVSLNVRHRVVSPARIAERTASLEIRLKL